MRDEFDVYTKDLEQLIEEQEMFEFMDKTPLIKEKNLIYISAIRSDEGVWKCMQAIDFLKQKLIARGVKFDTFGDTIVFESDLRCFKWENAILRNFGYANCQQLIDDTGCEFEFKYLPVGEL